MTDTIQLLLPRHYPLALILVGGYSFLQHHTLKHFNLLRKEIYGRVKFMDNFISDHSLAFGVASALHPNGDPDNVDGWYSRKLSYTEWFQLACAKRAYEEQVEQTPVATVFTLLSGLYFPLTAIGLGSLYLVGQYIFVKDYKVGGANTGKKCLGRIATKYALQGLAFLTITAGVMLAKEHGYLPKVLVKTVEGLFKK